MVLYNLTQIVAGNETNLLTFTQGVNSQLMNNMLGAIFLIGFAVVLFTSFMFSGRDLAPSFLGTAFICFTMALALVAMGLLNPIGMYVTFFASVVGVFFTWAR